MIKIDPTLLILMAEVFLAVFVLLVGTVTFLFKRSKRDKKAVASLQKRLEKNVGNRQEYFTEALSDENGEIDEASQELAGSIVEKENKFYDKLIDIYEQRDSSAFGGLDKMLHEYTSSYMDMVSVMKTQLETGQSELSEEATQQLAKMEEEGQKLATEIQSLKEDNERISKELAEAYNEIDQAMREYSVAFRSDGGKVVGGSAAVAATAVVAKPAAEQTKPAEQAKPVEEKVPEKAPPVEEVSDKPLDLEEDVSKVDEDEPQKEENDDSIDDLSENIADLNLLDEDLPEIEAVSEAEPEIKAEVETIADNDVSPEVEVTSMPEAIPDVDVAAEVEKIPETEVTPKADEVVSATDVAEEAVVTPEAEVIPEAVSEEVEPAVEEPVYVEDMLSSLGDDESLEDVVLKAMTEEKAAEKEVERDPHADVNQASNAPQADENTETKGPVIDLASDEALDLSEFSTDDVGGAADAEEVSAEDLLGDALDGLDSSSEETSYKTKGADIDEDELLAQLDEMNDDFDMSVLDELGDFGDVLSDNPDKEKKS